MYEETIRLDDGSRLKIEVWLQLTGTFSALEWSVRVSRCSKRSRNFQILRDFTVGKDVKGAFAERIKSALYSAWLEIKPEPIK